MAGKTKMPTEIVALIETVAKEKVEESQQKEFQNFRKECERFLKRVDKIIRKNTETGKIINRIKFLAGLLHQSTTAQVQVAEIINISHDFEKALNKYLGRKVSLTIVSYTGDITILSEKSTTDVYNKADQDTQSDRPRASVTGYSDIISKNRLHDAPMTAIQKEIDKSLKNRKAVFAEAAKRYDDSSKMDYAKDKDNPVKTPNLFWNIDNEFHKHWSEYIKVKGYIGEGYVSLALNTEGPSKFITYQHPMIYDKEAEEQIRLLAEYAQKGDAIAGILRGDVTAKARNDGNIQLAVKQGEKFRTASISIYFGIAYAILHFPQDKLIMPENLQKALESITEGQSNSWTTVFKVLTGEVVDKLEKNPNQIIFQI